MKFVIEKPGFEEFKRQWKWHAAMGYAVPTHEPIKLLEYADAPPLIMPTKAPVGSAGNGGNGKWTRSVEARAMGRRLLSGPGSGPMWCRNVRVGFFTAAIKLPDG